MTRHFDRFRNDFLVSGILFIVFFTLQLVAAFFLDCSYHGIKWDFYTYYIATNVFLYNIGCISSSFSSIVICAIIDFGILLSLAFLTHALSSRIKITATAVLFCIVKFLIFIAPFIH